ncbi:HdeD family acid-resistance protein [Kurthia huakuii]|jgi:uncharacterized membrane protein HdeD (DUF308 family)|uniref:HdeD family acid-resistance protein n=1 Tax=Kurthia huakuii TaxID=1421019 RepID=UPI0004955F02|nr:DUF308 domain-containing protein [Kurthia huakuii]MBM7698814.1 uncharacterized membrane protein HdeD (DUF308 family) [Kurthia huakuii]
MKKVSQFTLVLAVLSLVLALFLFINPVGTLKVIVITCAIIALVKGLSDIWIYFRVKKKTGNGPTFRLITGITIAALGLYLCVYPTGGVTVIGIIFAIWFLIEVCGNLIEIQAMRANKSWYWVAMIFNLLCLVVALLLLVRPSYAAISLTLMLAFYFLFQSIALFVGYFGLKKLSR